MDKRSFNLVCTMVIASMVIFGTYKIAKKKPVATAKSVSVLDKSKK